MTFGKGECDFILACHSPNIQIRLFLITKNAYFKLKQTYQCLDHILPLHPRQSVWEHATQTCSDQYCELLLWKISILCSPALLYARQAGSAWVQMPLRGNAQLMTKGDWLTKTSPHLFLKRNNSQACVPHCFPESSRGIMFQLPTGCLLMYTLLASFPFLSDFSTNASWDHFSIKCMKIILALGSASGKTQHELCMLFLVQLYIHVILKNP